MIKTSTRIAYLKRMLRRLEDEDTRIEQLIKSGELPGEAGDFTRQQQTQFREKLLSELRTLQAGKEAK